MNGELESDLNLLKRIIVAIIFIPLILWIFWNGGLPLGIFLALVALLQTWELQKLFLMKGISLPIIIALLSVFVFLSASYFAFHKLLFAYFLIFLFLFFTELLKKQIQGSVQRISAAVFSVTYTGLLLSSIVRISVLPDGNRMILALLILIWITDTFAYFVGISFGKHRNIFQVSPNKSLEGCLAGISFALIFALALFKIGFLEWNSLLLAALAAGIIGQLGDLFESLLKRDFGVKDSSHVLPGHGGLLDRFDSLLFAAPCYYFFLLMFGK